MKSKSADRDEQAKMAAKVFELSQGLEQKWVGAKYVEKRQLLDLMCLNFSLADVSLVAEMRKPFNMLAEGLLVSSNRGDKIRTCDLLVPNQALYQAELHPVGSEFFIIIGLQRKTSGLVWWLFAPNAQ